MKSFNFTIVKRLWLLAAVAIASLIIVGGTCLIVSGSLSSKLRDVNDRALPGVKTLLEGRNTIMTIRMLLLQHLSTVDDARRKQLENAIIQDNKKLLVLVDSYEKLVINDADRALFEADKRAVAAYDAVLKQVIEQLQINARFAAKQLVETQAVPLAQAAEAAFNKHSAYTMKLAERARASSTSAIIWGSAISWTLILLGAATVAALSFLLIRKIAGDLARMELSMRRIESELDFTTRVKVDGDDELGAMAKAINRLLDKMQSNLKSIASAAGNVAHSANMLNSTASQVAQAASAQSESASSMAASVEELTVSIHHVGDRASDANRLSVESGDLAKSGCRVIAQTVQDIQDISEAVGTSSDRIRQLEDQSGKISSVVRVIKEVAEQTNLLALNAAIEAARAGEQGRGFAVVADEVRKLAERTAASTQEISSTIEAMRSSAHMAVESMNVAVGRVSAGVARAQDASTAIEQIGSSSEQTVGMVAEINNAIREQSQASTAIAQMVERIAQMADESTAAAQGGARSARELDELANQMQRIVATYKL